MQKIPTSNKMNIQNHRPILGYRSHIKGHRRGQMLTAIGIYANNGMFSVAFAVIEAENKDTWTWFLYQLSCDLTIFNPHHWNFISEKQKGLIEALKNLWEGGPVAKNRHCARHLQSNFSKLFKWKSLKPIMMAAARAPTVTKFKRGNAKFKTRRCSCL